MTEKETALATEIKRLEKELSKTKQLYNCAADHIEILNNEKKATRNDIEGGFVMISRQAEKNLRDLQVQCPTAALVFSVIRENMQYGTNALTISTFTLGEILEKSRVTISRAIKYLKEKKYVQIIKVGTTNTYIINEAICFSGKPNQRKAVFSATIVAHEKEQEKGEAKSNASEYAKLKQAPIVITADEKQLITDLKSLQQSA